MPRHALLCLLPVMAAATAAEPAADPAPGSISLAASVGWYGMRMDRVTAAVTENSRGIGGTADSLDGVGIDLAAGYAPAAGSRLAFLGPSTRFQVRAGWLDASGDDSTTTSEALGFVDVEGSGNADGGGGAINTARAETDHGAVRFELLAGAGIATIGAFRMTAFGGVGLKMSERDNAFDLYFDGVRDPDLFVRDRIDATYYGLIGGACAATQLTSRLRFEVTLELELLGASADYEVDQRIGSPLSASDDDSAFAFGTALSTALVHDFGRVAVGLEASLDYLSWVPRASYQTDFNAGVPTAAHIEDDDLLVYGAALTVAATL